MLRPLLLHCAARQSRMFAGALTYIVNNCIMQRDSQAGCSPVTAQMGEAFPAASACLLLSSGPTKSQV